MASTYATYLVIFSTISTTFSATLTEDLNNLEPPLDFYVTIFYNCKYNPSLRYCKTTPYNLPEIFKFTIVESHLCNQSNNPNCGESFPKINLKNSPELAPLYLSFTYFWKYCPLTISSIDLSNNSLEGNFPSDIFHCSQIENLDLSLNNLSGDIPIQNLPLLTNLTFLNLSYNHFSEIKISDTKFFKRFNSSSFLHSGLLPNQRKYTIKAVCLLLIFPIFVILIVACLGWMCFCRPDFLPRVFRRKRKFTPSMLKAATNNFSKKNLVGKGYLVDIYKGVLRDGNEVRIEIYWDRISREEREKFVGESEILVEVCHKNLVKVLGWCDNRKLRAVVTEWIDGASVEMWVSRLNPPWKERMKMVRGVVEGMCYLNEEWPQVSYDLRMSGLLLSEVGDPLISRFKVEDQIRGTKKIYKLGVFILEMISNRRPREEFEAGEAGFVEWVRENYPDNVQNVIDERMRDTGHTLDQAKEVIGLGLMCANIWRGRQPSLPQIYSIVSRIHHSCMIVESPVHEKLRGEKKHRRMQSR